MVRAHIKSRARICYKETEGSDEEVNGNESEEEVEEEDDEPPPPAPPPRKKTAAKKTTSVKTVFKKPEPEQLSDNDNVVVLSDEEAPAPAEKSDEEASAPAEKSDEEAPAPAKKFKEDHMSEFEMDADEMDDEADSDFEMSSKAKKKTPAKKKKAPAKKTASKKKKPAKIKGQAKTKVEPSRSSGRNNETKHYISSEEESDGEEENGYESADEVPLKKRKTAKQSANSKVSAKDLEPEAPPVREMFEAAIKNLKENPKKGSSLVAIKNYIGDTWGVNMQVYAKRIKKHIIKGVEQGEIIQTRGKGAGGRFTIPGMKSAKKRARTEKLGKKWDDDQEEEYNPKKRARDEDRERHEHEMNLKRIQRKDQEDKKQIERELMPKKPMPPKKTDWAIEMIKGMRVREDKTYYQVKWEGSSKLTWEPEENLDGCDDAIDNFLIEEKTRVREEEMRKEREEQEGKYEVARVIEVKFSKNEQGENIREFLVRWKGHGEDDDSWEPEENLECPEIIENFMVKFRKRLAVTEKSLRQAPKKVERLAFDTSARKNKRNRGGLRKTYEGMDE